MAEGYPRKVAAYMAANPPPPFEVWQCNWRAFQTFSYLRTQWRAGSNGVLGLIYQEAYKRMDELGITNRPERLALMDDLQEMEAEVFQAIAEQREQQ